MAGYPRRVHDPDAVLDYPCVLDDWLDDGEIVLDAEVNLVQSSEYFIVDAVIPGDTIVAWISATPAAKGKKATLTFHWVTSAGRADDRSLTLVGEER
jgi:hypothetical protein